MATKPTKSKESVAATSPNFVEDRIERLRALFPEAVSEGEVDFEKLRQSLGEIADDRLERYAFTWAGKKDAIRLLQTPSRATLIPAPEESVDFAATQHLFLEGDNLEVLKLLYKCYAGRVKMIYIDPPYNTGKDFVYPDNFADPLDTYLKITGQKDDNGNHLSSNLETNGHYHSAWLNMMYPRLFVARQLLSEEGVIFVSIDDRELANLRLLMNEIFGEENFVSELVWNLGTGTEAGHFTRSHEYILVYARSKPALPYFPTIDRTPIKHGALKKISRANPASEITFPAGMGFEGKDATFFGELGGSEKQIIVSDKMIFENGKLKMPVTLRAGWAMKNQILSWLSDEETFDSKGQKVKQFYFNSQGILWYEKERGTKHPKTVINNIAKTKDGTNEMKSFFGQSLVDYPKPVELVKFLISLNTQSNDIVFDFFAGSSTTAQAVLDLNREDGGNRRFIMVQLPEPTKEKSSAKKAGFDTIADIGKERIRRVINRMNDEKNGELPLQDHPTPEDLGFKVFKLAESNYRQWTGVEEKDPKKYIQTLELFEDPLLPGWEAENVRYEVALKEGYSLNAGIEELTEIKTNTIHRVMDAEKDQFFYICLDPKFELQTVKTLEVKLGLELDDLLIVRDVALTDELANNIVQYCRLKVI